MATLDLTREMNVNDEIEVILGDYEFILKDGKTYFVKKQSQYPKDYEKCCEELKKVNLYECEWKGKKSYFGGSWFHWDIPAEEIKRIYEILQNK